MKRLKYTRRFVNVQLTGGKRKVRAKGDERHDRQTDAAAAIVSARVPRHTCLG